MHAIALALTLATAWSSQTVARSWQVDDLSHLDDVGQAEYDPTGRYLVVERLRPRAEMTRFDMDDFGEIGRGAILVFDLLTGSAPHPLLSIDPAAGYALGDFAPDGKRVVIYKLSGHTFELGVVEIATGRATWLGVTPELGRWGRGVEWLSPTRLTALVIPGRILPLNLRMGFEATEVLSSLSRKQAEGRDPSVIAVGSERYRDVRPRGQLDQLVVIDIATGGKRWLATGDFVDIDVSPDRRFAGLITNGADIQYPDTRTLRVGTPAFRRSLTLVDLQSGRVSPAAPDYDLLTHLLAWAPSSDRVLVYGRTGDNPWMNGRLLVVDALHGTVEARSEVAADVQDDRGDIPYVQADWDGEVPLLFGHAAGSTGGRSNWFRLNSSGPQNLTSSLPETPHLLSVGAQGMVFHSGDGFWRVDRMGQSVRLPTQPGSEPLTLLPPDEKLRFLFNNRPRRDWTWVREPRPGGQAILRLGQASSTPVTISEADQVIAADPSRERVVTMARDDHGVLTIALKGEGSKAEPLLRLNTGLRDIEPAVVRAVHHLSGLGTPVTSWLYLPPHLKPNDRLPLLVWAYPGEAYATAPEAEMPGQSSVVDSLGNAQILTAKGYAVLYASTPERPDLADPANGFEPDVLRAVDAAGATGSVDTNRLAFWGHSYGGYAALELATRSSRFGAIIASSSISDLASTGEFNPFTRFHPQDGLWINARSGWLEDGQAQLHTQPWNNPERYVRDSPLFSSGNIKTPVLLVDGGMDPVVPPDQAESMFASLYRQDKSAVLLTYFGEGHMIYSPANLKDLYTRVFMFLDENLKAPGRTAGS